MTHSWYMSDLKLHFISSFLNSLILQKIKWLFHSCKWYLMNFWKWAFFFKSLIHGSAYYQSVHNVIFLLNNIEVRKKIIVLPVVAHTLGLWWKEMHFPCTPLVRICLKCRLFYFKAQCSGHFEPFASLTAFILKYLLI